MSVKKGCKTENSCSLLDDICAVLDRVGAVSLQSDNTQVRSVNLSGHWQYEEGVRPVVDSQCVWIAADVSEVNRG